MERILSWFMILLTRYAHDYLLNQLNQVSFFHLLILFLGSSSFVEIYLLKASQRMWCFCAWMHFIFLYVGWVFFTLNMLNERVVKWKTKNLVEAVEPKLILIFVTLILDKNCLSVWMRKAKNFLDLKFGLFWCHNVVFHCELIIHCKKFRLWWRFCSVLVVEWVCNCIYLSSQCLPFLLDLKFGLFGCHNVVFRCQLIIHCKKIRLWWRFCSVLAVEWVCVRYLGCFTLYPQVQHTTNHKYTTTQVYVCWNIKNGTQYYTLLINNKPVQNHHKMYHTMTLFFNINLANLRVPKTSPNVEFKSQLSPKGFLQYW